MFTGIVEELGRVASVSATAVDAADVADAARLVVEATAVTADARPGDSIAVCGVCVTAVAVDRGSFSVDVMRETLDRSTLGGLAAGAPVNLERAVTLTTRLGGHLVQGHVDGVGVVADRVHTEQWDVVRIDAPTPLLRYIVEKGSIAVDGVSLTVASVDATSFTVSLIPTTLARTTLGRREVGERVNLEVDVMAKYAEKLLAGRLPHDVGAVGVDRGEATFGAPR